MVRPSSPLRDETRRAGWRELALLAGSTIAPLLLLEACARTWIAMRWPAERVEQMTAAGPYRGRFAIAAPLGYGLRPSHRSVVDEKVFTHNSLGFRGEEFPAQKPARQIRIVLMGGSTVYGLVVSDGETSSAVLQRSLREMLPDLDIAVINGAVPGWDSSDSVRSLEERVLPLSPDVVVVMDGRNDVWAQSFRNYRDDYSHYLTRDPEAIAATQSPQRRLFRITRAAMLFDHRAPALFRSRPELFFPVYARVRWENAPGAGDVVAFARDESRAHGFRKNLERIVALSRAHRVIPVLATIAFDPARYWTGLLPQTPEALAAERVMVLRNIELTREVAATSSVALFDGFAISKPELMFDDCHPNERGEEALGHGLAEVLRPLIEATAVP